MNRLHYKPGILKFTFLILAVFLFAMISCHRGISPEPLPGVSLELAEFRSKAIESIRYELFFNLTDSPTEPVTGSVALSFRLRFPVDRLILDFQAPRHNLLTVSSEGKNLEHVFRDEHIVIPGKYFARGDNSLKIDFVSTNQALNRQPGFMYTLFVPDRASTAFPCFDQPDLKAVFILSLDTPAEWISVANEKKSSENLSGPRKQVLFEPSRPISTYLFSFASGEFDTISLSREGKKMTMYHRETDTLKIKANQDEIFRQHIDAISWLEEYTHIDYPFSKFDFVAIPFFQYGGMEHPGAILYRASRLFLDENASSNELLARANLIAHETAHMWFGDLVTMKWFNDVWMKEVFANFIADKIVNPLFPEFDHRQRFLFSHFPRAYEIDRSRGANAIRQELDNLKNAGTLYGNIIYHKAPIMMNQLEKLLGEENLRTGLRNYLSDFAFGNASWPDLIAILKPLYPGDLENWSRIWVDEPGMPEIRAILSESGTEIIIEQTDPAGKNRIWSQVIETSVRSAGEIFTHEVLFDKSELRVEQPFSGIVLILPDASGGAYGTYRPDDLSRMYLIRDLQQLGSSLERGIGLLILWEELLQGSISPEDYLETLLKNLSEEPDIQNRERILEDIRTAFWTFLDPDTRKILSHKVEDSLWKTMSLEGNKSLKTSVFRTYASVSLTNTAMKKLFLIWRTGALPGGVLLSETDLINLACEIKMKRPNLLPGIMEEQLERISNPERRENFRFVIPALSENQKVRDAFFESLKEPGNRRIEPRVVQALQWLHHPLRSGESAGYIRPSLEMLREIQVTGDIFFPKNWLDATLGGHQSMEARQIVEDFLAENPEYPSNLKGKILQSADLLFRVTEMKEVAGK